MGGKRLENVGTPLENFQATNKFYVDTLVEASTAGDKAFRKIQDGTFASNGEIDMNGNSITGLPNPADKDAAANKNYVDNGGAIVKNPDGSFTAISDIDFIGYRLKNLSNPKDERDAVNKIYVDKKLSLPSLISPIISDNNKYLAVGEVSMGGKRLENVGTPLENFQATNKFYADTLVEASTAGDKALRKIQDGTFASNGEIDMNGNSITGLPNPADKDAAANKNYVDNGGAIVKNPDGSFTAISDIDFIGYRLKNLSNPKDERDAVNKIYVDKKLSLPSLISPKPIRTVWAEEKGSLGDGHYEFSFGNGSAGAEHAYGGYCMAASGRIIRGSLTATESKNIFVGEIKVNITVNGKEQAQ